jgi:hypothetical protein
MKLVQLPGLNRRVGVPTEQALAAIPQSIGAEFVMRSEKELRKARSWIYSVNARGGPQYRTIRSGLILMIWRWK